MRSDIIPLENEKLRLEIAHSIGPRILGLSFEWKSQTSWQNCLTILLSARMAKPIIFTVGTVYGVAGRPCLSYDLEDGPVEILPVEHGIKIKKQVDAVSGIEKSIQVVLPDQIPKVVITHELKNCNSAPVKCAPWAITQLRTGGTAILPMNNIDTGLLPNQNLVLWPYTDLGNRNIRFGRQFLLVKCRQ